MLMLTIFLFSINLNHPTLRERRPKLKNKTFYIGFLLSHDFMTIIDWVHVLSSFKNQPSQKKKKKKKNHLKIK